MLEPLPTSNSSLVDPLLTTAGTSLGPLHTPWPEPTSNFGDIAFFIDTLSMDQPILPFSSTSLFSDGTRTQSSRLHADMPDSVGDDPQAPRLFDDFTSTFPSFDPPPKSSAEPWKVTQEIWDHFLTQIQSFAALLPPQFFLPSRHTMTRYITTYFTGFHRHLPFLHVPSFSPIKCPVELVLAMATIGAQSAFDHANAIMFYRTSLAIVQERLQRRKTQRRDKCFPAPASHPTEPQTDQFDPLPPAQTLLILMAMATWGNSHAIFNEAVGLQSTLANYIRDEKLLAPPPSPDPSWASWVQAEGMNRTINIIFCFFIFHTIVYDTPPAILNCELQTRLPCRETVWEAPNQADWIEARKSLPAEPTFQSAFSRLFVEQQQQQPTSSLATYHSLGGYTLILAIIQHIYFLRATNHHRQQSDGCLSPRTTTIPPPAIAAVEQALKNWQVGCGPISFNATALLRMAYIRLSIDVGPWRALTSHNPGEIAASMYAYHRQHSHHHHHHHHDVHHRLTRTVLYSAHALSIPVKIGVNIVARNQAFAWSLQHALCALECAFVTSQWLLAMEARRHDTDATLTSAVEEREHHGVPRDPGSEQEREEAERLLAYIKDMVAEADPAGELAARGGRGNSPPVDLCVHVLKIWQKLLSGDAVWDVVRLIGRVLEAYWRILEGGLASEVGGSG
ncbi:hypothetical protein BO86DRAFT_430580 [Aspergillus japonicus CBS 114.51]|uniref:Xylanolytic transcriptional activator regulatory domain-containing protein n=1 Tax=Aspergillus japonicus CBS 114.51 TaxID=1448312 RepID=A0A8T8X1V1_ASPJA|nr:hypothetical protein BO86DRAFT_430580 [Aspergillus japonicus CBS 114.51]RAH81612.1 hypothetical protein BO86DRAFT_430580 [Aspergillus japonicus CBS 114.51]